MITAFIEYLRTFSKLYDKSFDGGYGWQVVGEKTVRAVVSVVLKHLEGVVEDGAWVLSNMCTLSGACRVPLEDMVCAQYVDLRQMVLVVIHSQDSNKKEIQTEPIGCFRRDESTLST